MNVETLSAIEPKAPAPAAPAQAMPSAAEQMANAFTALGQFAKSGGALASDDLLAERLAICKACEKLQKGAVFNRCSACGCSLWFKQRMAVQSCPIGKWGAAI